MLPWLFVAIALGCSAFFGVFAVAGITGHLPLVFAQTVGSVSAVMQAVAKAATKASGA